MGNLSGESREQSRKDKVTRFRSVTYARQLGLLVNTLGSHLKRSKNPMYGRRMNRAFASDALILQLNKSKNTIVEPEYQKVLRRVEFPGH